MTPQELRAELDILRIRFEQVEDDFLTEYREQITPDMLEEERAMVMRFQDGIAKVGLPATFPLARLMVQIFGVLAQFNVPAGAFLARLVTSPTLQPGEEQLGLALWLLAVQRLPLEEALMWWKQEEAAGRGFTNKEDANG